MTDPLPLATPRTGPTVPPGWFPWYQVVFWEEADPGLPTRVECSTWEDAQRVYRRVLERLEDGCAEVWRRLACGDWALQQGESRVPGFGGTTYGPDDLGTSTPEQHLARYAPEPF